MRKNKVKLLLMAMALTLVVSGCGFTSTEDSVVQNDITSDMNQEDSKTDTGSATTLDDSQDGETVSLTGEFKEFKTADLQGNAITANDVFKGQELTVINLWGTFCGPCISEMPDLGELAQEYSEKGVKFVGIPVDVTNENTLVTAIDIVDKTKANYLHLLPTEDLYNIYLKGVSVVPETLFVDKTGTIIKSIKGAKNKKSWKKLIDEAYEQVV